LRRQCHPELILTLNPIVDIQVNLAELEKAVSSGADIDLGDPYCEGFKALHFLAFKASTEG
jgi:hypothetical protein